MEIITTVPELKAALKKSRQAGQSIGFVPTMGYLHDGHLTLMRKAKEENGVVIASIFVNPLQFGPNEDYAVYPRDLKRDSELAAAAGVDILFTPGVEDMYPGGYDKMSTFVDVQGITTRLCGGSRPGHFRGVATVVTKLFNIVEPDAAYFGQKDAQQVAVIKRMVLDLNMNVKVIAVPTVREADGLAMSSRNVRLNEAERQAALVLRKSLLRAEDMMNEGERSVAAIVTAMTKLIEAEPLAKIDYVSICDSATIEELAVIDRPVLIALAVKFGGTRLIDNMIWGE